MIMMTVRKFFIFHQILFTYPYAGLTHSRKVLVTFICTIMVWLHLRCGLSRANADSLMKTIHLLISLAINFGRLLVKIQHPDLALGTPLPTPLIPHDVRTAITTLSLDPTIIRSICCPKCYSKYSLNHLPEICHQRETARSQPCGAKLWTTRSTRSGPRRVPCRLYSTQDFDSWLEFFLSRPGIEDLIDKSYDHNPSPNIMCTIWDSPAWRSLGSFTTTHGNLTFAYFIDWFNPLLNKTAGKTVSCGAIILICLNLPYELQHLVENTFFAGITPPPKEPSVTTITAVSDPIVDRLQAMFHGKVIRTRRHPDGIIKRVAVLPVIADLMAIRKVLGFAGIKARNFCSFCDLSHAEMDCLSPSYWRARIGTNVRQAAIEWQQAETKVKRNKIFDQHGVRWSALHRLDYRDPVQHTVLGMMHNWIEGILQHHARVKWGIGITPGVIPSHLKDQDCDQDHGETSNDGTPHITPTAEINLGFIDIHMLDEELADLEAESQIHSDAPSNLKRQHSESSEPMDEDEDDNLQDNDEDFQLDSDSDSEDDEKASEWDAAAAASVFNREALLKIHECINDAVVPTWITRPPRNLGEKSHGKLTADQWYTLFTIFLPMVLPELWLASGKRRDLDLLNNFYDLVTCTNIIGSYTISNAAADDYLHYYIRYRQTSKTLFPTVAC